MSSKLTKAELGLLPLLAWGAGVKQAARRLGKSDNTVNNQRRSIYGKAGVNSAVEHSVWYFVRFHDLDIRHSPLEKVGNTLLNVAVVLIASLSFFILFSNVDLDMSLISRTLNIGNVNIRTDSGV